MKQMKDYFTTGEFSKLCNVKKQTLFHYDDIGIFKPEVVGENEYRYYSYTQLETFEVLTMFRDLNVPLKEIKQHMDNRSPKALINLLQKRKDEMDQLIKRLQIAEKYIDQKIKITAEGINAPVGEIVFEDIPDEYLINTDYAGTVDQKAVAEAAADHFKFCRNLGVQGAYSIGAMIPRDSVTSDNHIYSKFYSTVDESVLEDTGYEGAFLDVGGKYISIYDNHGYENIGTMCRTILAYAQEHHLSLDNNFYEEVVLDDLSIGGYDKHMVKVTIKVI